MLGGRRNVNTVPLAGCEPGRPEQTPVNVSVPRSGRGLQHADGDAAGVRARQRRGGDRVVAGSQRRQQVEVARRTASQQRRVRLEQVEQRPVGVEHPLPVAVLGRLVVAGQFARAPPSGPGRRCSGPRWRCRRGSATSWSSTQLASTPSSGAGSSIGRCVWRPRFGMIVTYCPASRPKRIITRRMRSMLLRGSTPEVVADAVRRAGREGDLDVPGGALAGPVLQGRDQLPVDADLCRSGADRTR